MEQSEIVEVVVVGGGIAGCAVALRAAQYHLDTVWVLGDRKTAKASRAEYVYNIDNMIGVHPDIVRRKVDAVLSGDEHAAARDAVAGEVMHISTKDIVENVKARLETEFGDVARMVAEAATSARRDGDLFVVETTEGTEIRARNMVLATGVMDVQPKVKSTTKRGKVIDDVQWIYPFANNETLLYCIRCEGHLTRDHTTAVIGHAEGAAQISMMLHERYGSRVVILTNGEEPVWEERTGRLLEGYGIDVATSRITGLVDGGERPKGSTLHGFELEDGSRVDANFGMIAMGLYRVYNDLAVGLGAALEESDEPAEQRHVLIEDRTGETSVRGLFCVGDMSKRTDGGPVMKQVYTCQEFAVRAVDTIDRRRRSARRKQMLLPPGAEGRFTAPPPPGEKKGV
jgi:thioredoxin reductase (NADPH)